MKKFFSTAYSGSAFNLATLAIRVVFGFLLCYFYGLEKFKNFSHLQSVFPDPLHITHRISLALVIFSELLCSLLVALGFLTRFAALVLVIEFCVAEFLVHRGHVAMMNGTLHEQAWLYFAAFFSILMLGPGRISIDSAMGK
ncbi:MAG TPA: DoxX family protein [Puia sp.]|nr:DoxX family protein [Puia sp.]